MNNFLASIGAAAMAVGFNATAQASIFTESVQFGPGPTDYSHSTGTTAGPGGNSLYFFDSNGGTLNSITFSYNYSINSSITLTNTSASASSGSARTQSASQFSSDDAGVTAALNSVVNNYVDPIDGNSASFGSSTLSPIAADVRGTASSYSLAPGGSTSFSSTGSYSRSGITVSMASILNAFSRAGGGTFTPEFSTLSGLLLSNSGGNTSATQVTTAQGNLVISFDYDTTPPASVPEPAMLGMVAGGIALLGVARRRRTAA